MIPLLQVRGDQVALWSALIPLLVGLGGLLVWLPDRAGAAAPCVAIRIFAVIGYTNYFLVRLSYPVGGWISGAGRRRTPQLVRDIRSPG